MKLQQKNREESAGGTDVSAYTDGPVKTAEPERVKQPSKPNVIPSGAPVQEEEEDQPEVVTWKYPMALCICTYIFFPWTILTFSLGSRWLGRNTCSWWGRSWEWVCLQGTETCYRPVHPHIPQRQTSLHIWIHARIPPGMLPKTKGFTRRLGYYHGGYCSSPARQSHE